MRKSILTLLVLASIAFGQASRSNAGFDANKLDNGDDNFVSANLGFVANFFGQRYGSTFVTNNGNITFGSINTIGGAAAWVPSSLRTLSIPIIAPFYADVDTTRTAQVTYGTDTIDGRRAFGVNYLGVGYFNAKSDKLNSFQVVLIERLDTGAGNFDIEFNYDSIAWDIGDDTRIGRAYASVGYSNGLGGSQNSAFELPGSLTMGAFLNSGPFALVRQTRNSGGVLGRLVFEVRNGEVNNTTLLLQPTDTIYQCPEMTIVARGSGYSAGSAFVTPRFQPVLTENGQARPITNFVATQVPNASPGTYDFRVSFRSNPTVSDNGVATNSNIGLTITIPGTFDQPARTASDTKAIRNCGVAADCGTLPKDGRVGFSLSGRASASGGIPPYVFTAPAGVPAGLAFARDGAMTGTPSAPGNFTYTVRVDDFSTSPVQFGLVRCSINVVGTATPLTGTCSTPAGTAGSIYSGAITANGGAGQYRFTLSGGSLPPGLALNSAGAISGSIASTASGNYPFATTITDAANVSVVVNCSIQVTAVVIPVPAITTLNPSQAVVASPAFTLSVAGSNFASTSILVWNGFDLRTTFVSASSLTASIPANLLGAAGIAKVRIRNTSTVQSAEVDFEVLNPLSISSINPTSLSATGTATQISINGDGFFPAITLSLNGTRTTLSRISSQQLQATVPASLLTQPGVITARLDNPNGIGLDSRINVVSAVTVTPSVSVDKPALVTDQSTAIVRLAQAPGQPLTGILEITFVPAADNGPNNGANDFPRFTSVSTRRINFNLAATATEFRAPIDQGSVAGTATVTLTSLSLNGVDVLNGQRITQTLVIDAAAPLILPGSVVMVRTATGFNVEITALSTQRSLTGGTVTFSIASGITNSGSATFAIDNLAAVSSSWFQSAQGRTEGGGFKLTLPYTLEGDFNNISSVQVTLSNARGNSTPVSGGRR